jgi:hypothetical protein
MIVTKVRCSLVGSPKTGYIDRFQLDEIGRGAMSFNRSSLLIILLIAGPAVLAASWNGESHERDRQLQARNEASEQDKGYGAWVGATLSRVLLRDSAALVGRLQAVVGPDEEQAQPVDPRLQSYSEVTVAIEEWLYGDQQQYANVLHLEQVPVYRGVGYGSQYRGAVWRDVDLNTDSRVLVFFYPKSSPEAKVRMSIDRYGLVVSKEWLFPAIKETLRRHTQLAKDPDRILDAPNWLNDDKYNVVGGYLVNYLWVAAAHDHPDSTAIALSRLMGNNHLVESQWRMLEMPLVGVLAGHYISLSPSVRGQVMEMLVNAGCSEDSNLAKSALRVLTLLGEAGQLDLRSFLIGDNRQKLSKNYMALVQSEFEKDRRATIERQLGLRER